MPDRAPHARLLSIGSELLLGETIDTNAAYLGGRLARLGLELRETRHLPDDRGLIAAAFREARGAADLVLATGGLGPTHDDLTREALADALGEELATDPALEATLRERFGAYGPMPDANLRQALRVPSAAAIANPIGSAPGWWVDRGDGGVVALMPGVPSEMRRMWSEELASRIADRFALRPIQIRTIKTFGMGESAVADRLGSLLSEPPTGVEAGIYARDDGVHVRFTTRGDASVLEPVSEATIAAVGEHVWGQDDDELAGVMLAAMGRAGVGTLASWEADTNGALLGVLSAADALEGSARYVGGLLDAGGAAAPPLADAVLQVSLLSQDAHGRSRVRASVSGHPSLPVTELRIHGSGPQRLRRAAFAALNWVRQSLD